MNPAIIEDIYEKICKFLLHFRPSNSYSKLSKHYLKAIKYKKYEGCELGEEVLHAKASNFRILDYMYKMQRT